MITVDDTLDSVRNANQAFLKETLVESWEFSWTKLHIMQMRPCNPDVPTLRTLGIVSAPINLKVPKNKRETASGQLFQSFCVESANKLLVRRVKQQAGHSYAEAEVTCNFEWHMQ